jgi:hypothetical protein
MSPAQARPPGRARRTPGRAPAFVMPRLRPAQTGVPLGRAALPVPPAGPAISGESSRRAAVVTALRVASSRRRGGQPAPRQVGYGLAVDDGGGGGAGCQALTT